MSKGISYRRGPEGLPSAWRLLVCGMAILTTVAVGVGGATPGGTGATDAPAGVPGGTLATGEECNRTATEAVSAQNRTRELVRELRQFARESSAVDPEAKQAAEFYLGRGEQRFRNERYCNSLQQFRTARDRARAELTAAYRAETELLLDASLARLEDLDGSNGKVRTLTTRVEDVRDQLAAADTLRERRDAYRAAESVHADTAGVGVSLRTRVLEHVWIVLIGGAVGLFLVGRGSGIRLYLSQQDDGSGGAGGGRLKIEPDD
jgi:hypothetical protein